MDLDYYKKILKTEEEKLIKEVGYYRSEDPYLDKYRPSETLDNTITEIEGHDRLTSTEADLKLFLAEVKLALKRIENKTFGICENCGDKIGDERLAVIPTAALCKSCQAQKKGA